MDRNIVVKPEIAKQFKNAMDSGQVVLLSAPCGMGKTTVARALLAGRRVLEISAGSPDFEIPETDGSWDVLLVDSLQKINEPAVQHALCGLIKEHNALRFVLMSRGSAPGWIVHFQYTGAMITIDTKGLMFGREETGKFFEARGISAGSKELDNIYRETKGYPLVLSILARHMSSGEVFGNTVITEIQRELFMYYQEAIYYRLEPDIRRFLLDLAPFETLNTELAKTVSGNSRAGEMLGKIHKKTSMFLYDNIDEFRMWPVFRQFLMWEMEQEYTDEQTQALYGRAALYYETNEDYDKALECYTKAGNRSGVSALLVKNARKHPGAGNYEAMEKYYMMLDDSEIVSSPLLMQAMSMLCSLRGDYEASEKWYQELRNFAGSRLHTDRSSYKEAKSRLAWLDISLPQRSIAGIASAISTAFRHMMNREIALPEFSVTSKLPSIMNGGKDFSEWSKKDDLFYAVMKTPVEAILGKDGVGLADCAITESKFEKGESVSGRIFSLVSKMGDIQTKGTPDIEFALVGLLVRTMIDEGRACDAMQTAVSIRKRFEEAGNSRFLPNIDALICRINLITGDAEAVDMWYRQKAPKDPVNFKVMRRYRYLTQAMAEIAAGENRAALITLAPMVPYCKTCSRHIDGIHVNVLTAIAKYRSGVSDWRDNMNQALDTALSFGFIRTIGEYGAAVLNLLGLCKWDKNTEFLRRVTEAARQNAVYYPDFMKIASETIEPLTTTELQVLRLICADKTNSEIGEILDIKVSTVKSHVSHILQKLSVKRRNEAKTVAEKLKLL